MDSNLPIKPPMKTFTSQVWVGKSGNKKVMDQTLTCNHTGIEDFQESLREGISLLGVPGREILFITREWKSAVPAQTEETKL